METDSTSLGIDSEFTIGLRRVHCNERTAGRSARFDAKAAGYESIAGEGNSLLKFRINSCGERRNHLCDAAMRFAGESVLEMSGDGKAEERERIVRPRYGFQFIPDIAVLRIEGEKEALFAFFDVERCCGIEEAEGGWCVHDFDDAAQVQRPEAKGVHLNRNDLSCGDRCSWVRDAYPSEIEGDPALDGEFGSLEVRFAIAEERTGNVVNESKRKARLFETCLQAQKRRLARGKMNGGCERFVDRSRRWFFVTEHGLSMPVAFRAPCHRHWRGR